MTNQEVCNRWASQQGKPCKGNNLRWEGNRLISYRTTIAFIEDGVAYLSKIRFSKSTDRHLGYARRSAARVGHQIVRCFGFARDTHPSSRDQLMAAGAADSHISWAKIHAEAAESRLIPATLRWDVIHAREDMRMAGFFGQPMLRFPCPPKLVSRIMGWRMGGQLAPELLGDLKTVFDFETETAKPLAL